METSTNKNQLPDAKHGYIQHDGRRFCWHDGTWYENTTKGDIKITDTNLMGDLIVAGIVQKRSS